MSRRTEASPRTEYAGKTIGTEVKRTEPFVTACGEETIMPILSMFYGIVIRMYFYDDKQHHVPHLHAEYAGQRSVFSLGDGAVLAGELPPGKMRLVQAWIEIHREELLADWELAVNGEEVFKIEPLK
jgi:hypothetical protein